MRTEELFLSLAIIGQIISVVVVVGGPGIFLIREFRIGMCETFL
jgi:hypothetical protein